MPWISRVHLVTSGQRPSWLGDDNTDFQVVTHEMIFPDKDHLPTFNSIAIECNLHRIADLTSSFIYFNDDVLVTRPVERAFF
jgi:hypothetical protein